MTVWNHTSKEVVEGSNRKRGPGYYLKRDWDLYLLLVVPFIFLILFKYASYFGLVIAFKDYKVAKGFAASDWAGFEIFQKVFHNRNFIPALKNTLLTNLLDLAFGFPMPIILALILNEIRCKTFKRVTQTLLYLPHFLSWVIIGSIAYQLLGANDGIVNVLRESIGLGKIPFLQENRNWLITYVFIGVWQTMGWNTIIYLASITSVNPELYEAATVDGAGRWKQCLHVTLPCIRGTIVTLLIMNLGRVMGGSFERIFALSNAKATQYTTTIPVLVYRWGIESGKFSESTALGLFQSLIGVLLVVISDFIAKRLGEEGLI